MSVLIYYNNHFVADRGLATTSEQIDLALPDKGKIYLDPEKRFAVGMVGVQLEHTVLTTIFGAVVAFINSQSLGMAEFDRILKACNLFIERSHLLFATESNLVEIVDGMPVMLDRERHYSYGTGAVVARVLMQAKHEFNPEKWIRMIALSDRHITREYDSLDLSVLNQKPKVEEPPPPPPPKVPVKKAKKKRVKKHAS